MNYKEIKVGMKVDYKAENGRVVKNCTVFSEPWYMDLKWVCRLDKFERCVECDRLTPAKRV
jgi:hypothetical protein